MVEQRVDGFTPAVNHLHDRWRETRGLEQFEDPSRCNRHTFGGFQQETIAGGDRVRQEPERDHAREIEGRDRRHDPQRLADQMLIDARRDVLVIASVHQHRNPAGDLDILDGAPHLGGGLGVRLSAFVRDGAARASRGDPPTIA